MLLAIAALLLYAQGEPAMDASIRHAAQVRPKPAREGGNASATGPDRADSEEERRVAEAGPEWRRLLKEDARWTRVRDTDTVFAPVPFEDVAGWESFASALRKRILVGCGLYPLPERTPLNATVELAARKPDYSVYRVSLEASPGFYVTGNLYRPAGDGPFPAIACPHGHWERGRLENSSRSSVPGRCITFARMGAVAFSYDMAGYNDSLQFGDHHWGSQEDLLWGIHPFSAQLWSGIRVLDFLENLPYADPERLACTGASGGGTQTFALCAVDGRVKTAAPVNMISHTMQGGCLCENAPLIRLENSNMEIGALMAPRPLLLVSATGDWTRETPQAEYPAIRAVYGLYGAADHVENVHIKAGHNYNQTSREAVYRFFGEHLFGEPGRYADFTEPPFEVEPDETLRLFPDGGKPADWPSGEEVIAQWKRNRAQAAASRLPAAPEAYPGFRSVMGPALRDVCGLPPDGPAVEHWRGAEAVRDGARRYGAVIGREGEQDRVPLWLYVPEGSKATVVTVGAPEMRRGLLEEGVTVVEVEPFAHREAPGLDREYGAFPETFLPTNAAYRIHDILTALDYARGQEELPPLEALLGGADMGPSCLVASALDGRTPRTYLAGSPAPANDAAWLATCYLPGIRALGGAAAAAALIAPRELVLLTEVPESLAGSIQAAYAAAGAPGAFKRWDLERQNGNGAGNG